MNYTMSEYCLVQSQLVFEVMPWFLVLNTIVLVKKKRIAEMKKAQAEMNTLVVERNVQNFQGFQLI